jgi:hypothetical protein
MNILLVSKGKSENKKLTLNSNKSLFDKDCYISKKYRYRCKKEQFKKPHSKECKKPALKRVG